VQGVKRPPQKSLKAKPKGFSIKIKKKTNKLLKTAYFPKHGPRQFYRPKPKSKTYKHLHREKVFNQTSFKVARST
jgi:hypothetical protein